jgi:hypothetical protein
MRLEGMSCRPGHFTASGTGPTIRFPTLPSKSLQRAVLLSDDASVVYLVVDG